MAAQDNRGGQGQDRLAIKPFRLPDLPYDIRRMIYVFVIRNQNLRNPKLIVAAKVNQRLYEEILPVHLTESAFTVEFHGGRWVGRCAGWKWLSGEDVKLIKDLSIKIPENVSSFRKRTHTILSNAKFEHLTIEVTDAVALKLVATTILPGCQRLKTLMVICNTRQDRQSPNLTPANAVLPLLDNIIDVPRKKVSEFWRSPQTETRSLWLWDAGKDVNGKEERLNINLANELVYRGTNPTPKTVCLRSKLHLEPNWFYAKRTFTATLEEYRESLRAFEERKNATVAHFLSLLQRGTL